MNNFLNGVGIGGQTNYGTVYLDNNGQVQTVSPGTSGYVLTSNGSSAAPTFQLAGTSGLSGLTTDGVLYASASNAAASTAAGTSGQVLTSNGAGSAPSFQAASGGGTPAYIGCATPGIATWSSSSTLMGGINKTFTPGKSGNVFVVFTMRGASHVAPTIQYGTGTPPSNQGALAGTQISFDGVTFTTASSGDFNYTLIGFVTGLAIGTTYWIDLAGSYPGGIGSFGGGSMLLIEF